MNPQLRSTLLRAMAPLICLFSTGCAIPGRVDYPPTAIDKEDWSIIHPVLNIKAGEKLRERLGPAAFIRLNSLKIPDGVKHYQWSTYFRKAETDAAEQICGAATGLSKLDAERLFGRPKYQGGTIDCWAFVRPGDDIWVYYIGGNLIPIRLTFRDSICKEAALCTIQEDADFQIWMAERICKLAGGKSVPEILNSAGPCSAIYNSHNQQCSALPESGNGFIHYDISPSIGAKLIIENGICKKGEPKLTAH